MPSPRSRPLPAQDCAIRREDLVAVDQFALFVSHQHPIGIAVQRDAELRAVFDNLRAEILRHRGAAAAVDVEAVGRHADRDDRGAEFPQHGRCDAIGRAMRAIDDDLQPAQPQATREARLGNFDIAAGGVVEARGAAQRYRGGQAMAHVARHQRLDLGLGVVAELEPVGTEQLDAVVLIGIVRGGDHHPEIGAQAAGQHGDRRRRQRPDQGYVHAGADEPCGECRLHHVAGQPRVLADHHAMAMAAVCEQESGRLAQPQRSLGGHRIGIRGAADAVGSEQMSRACHRLSALPAELACSLCCLGNGSACQKSSACQTIIA